MKEQQGYSFEIQPRGERRGLTQQPQKPYAELKEIFMVDPEDILERKSQPEQSSTQESQKTQHLASEKKMYLQFAVLEAEKKMQKVELKHWEKKDLEAEYSKLADAIKNMRASGLPKKEITEWIKPARSLQREIRTTLLRKRLIEKRDKSEQVKRNEAQKTEEGLLRKMWFRRFNDEELKNPDTIQAINAAVELGYTPKLVDDEEMKEIVKLDDAGRIERAEELLHEVTKKEIDLTTDDAKKKRDAILEAHNVAKGEEGKDGKEAGVFNYTSTQLLKKYRILQAAGFSEIEIESLIEAGIVGDGTEVGKDHFDKYRRQEYANKSIPLAQKEITGVADLAGLEGAVKSVKSAEDLYLLQLRVDQIPQEVGLEVFTDKDFSKKYADIRSEIAHASNVFPMTPERKRELDDEYGLKNSLPEWKTKDEALVTGNISNRILHLFNRIENVKKEDGTYDVEQGMKYYNRLRRYVKYVLDNVYEEGNEHHPERSNSEERQLRLPKEMIERLDAIFSMTPKQIQYSDNPQEYILDQTKYLFNDMKLHTFFKHLDKEYDEENERVGKGRQLPNSLEEVADLIVHNYGEDFEVGGRYEIFNEYNEFQAQNLLAWARARMKDLDDGSPDDQIDCLSEISLRTEYSPLKLIDMIITPNRFLSLNNIRLRGTVDGEVKGDEVVAKGGEKKVHEDMETGRWILLYEAWLFGSNHTFDAKYRQIRGIEDQVPKVLQEMFRNSAFTTDARILKMFKLARIDQKEFREYRDKEAEGEVGRAMRRMVLAYNYLAHLTDNKDRNWQDTEHTTNMFMKVMGKEGMEVFYNTLATEAMSSKTEIKEEYKKYVLAMLEKEKAKHTDEEILKMLEKRMVSVEKAKLETVTVQAIIKGQAHKTKEDLTLSLDYLSELEDIRIKAKEKEVKRGLTEDEQKEVRESIERDVKHSIQGEFIDKLKGKYIHVEKDKKTKEVKSSTDIMSLYTTDKEKFALLAVEQFLQYSKKQLNFFSDKKPENRLEQLMRKAITAGSCNDLKLDENEAEYAGMWAWRYRNWTGIAARNDTGAIGFDAWSKFMNVRDYRVRQEDERSGSGNRHTIPGIKRMSVTLWEGVEFRKEGSSETVRLIDALQGGQGNAVNLGMEIGKGIFQQNAMADFADTHLGSAKDLFALIGEEMYMHLDKIASIDPTGKLMIDEAAFFKMRDSWHKKIRYTYDQMKFDYDKEINVWERKTKMKDGKVVRDENGAAVTELEFKSMKLRDYFFNHEVNHMGMNKRFGEDPGKEKKMARNVWAYLIAKEIEHHIESGRIHHAWTIDQLRLMQQAFAHMAADVEIVEEHGHEHFQTTSPMYDKKEFDTILRHAGINPKFGMSAFGWLETKDVGKQTVQAGTAGFFAVVKSALKAASPFGGK